MRPGRWRWPGCSPECHPFSAGVILQIGPAATLGKALAVPASAGMVLGLLIAAWCLAKNRT